MFDVRVTTNRTAGLEVVWSAKTFESAWDEFLNQIAESHDDEYIEIQLIEVDEILYRFVKDEIDGGTLYHIDVDGEQEDCLLDGSPDMQVASWTGTKEPKHFLTISDHYGNDVVDVETTEEIESQYLVYHSFTGYYYKNKPLNNFVVSGKL